MVGANPASYVRSALPEDYEDVARLNRAVQSLHLDRYPSLFKEPSDSTLTREAYSGWLESGCVFVAIEDGRVAGYLQARVVEREETPYRHAGRILYVDQLCVASTSQLRGHGGELLEAAKQRSRDLAISRIELDTWALNREARGFLEAEGFEEMVIRLARDE